MVFRPPIGRNRRITRMVLHSAYESRANFKDLRSGGACGGCAVSYRRRRLGNGVAQRLRKAESTPIALVKLVRIGRVDHPIEAYVVMHVPMSHQRPALEQV